MAPVVGSPVTLVAGTQNWSSTVSGTTNDYFISGNWKIAAGRQFSDDEERAGKAVCVIGNTVRKELFGAGNPVGSSIRVKTFDCEVIGLLVAKGQGGMGQDQDDTVLMPLRTTQRRLTGSLDIGNVMVSLKDGTDSTVAIAQLRSLLRERRKLAENADDNFNVMDTKQLAETLSGTIGTGHHYYYIGAPRYWLMIGGIFSALEPLAFLGMAIYALAMAKKGGRRHPNKAALNWTLGSAIMSFVGAGFLGFAHAEQGDRLTRREDGVVLGVTGDHRRSDPAASLDLGPARGGLGPCAHVGPVR